MKKNGMCFVSKQGGNVVFVYCTRRKDSEKARVQTANFAQGRNWCSYCNAWGVVVVWALWFEGLQR